MKHLILVRHGSLNAAFDGRYIGSTEAGLSEHGIKESAAIGNYLEPKAREKIYGSPKLRVRQSLEAAGIQPDTVIWDKRIAEIDFGQCENLTYDEICQKFPDIREEWRPNNLEFTFPGGENTAKFRDRIKDFIRDIVFLDDEIITIFTHGGVINIFLEYLLNLPAGDIWRYAPSRGSLSVIRLTSSGEASLPLLNYRPYLFAKGTMPWPK